jgi:Membrane carboxypeptidase/penicillin-binding protein
MPRWFAILLGLALLVLAGALLLAVGVTMLWPRLPDLNKVTDYRPDLPLRVYSAQHTLIGEFGVQRRAVIPYDQVPKQLKQAVLAAEDSRFFDHGAVDFAGVARAALADFGAGGAVQGASTITMQVARDFYLSPEKTPLRKFVEALMAYKIENTLTKDQILDRYLNQVYLGQRAYGFAAAAQVYYGKPLTELSLAQMAVLAGLPQAPSAYNPQNSMKLAVWRQHYVLGRMLALGDITKQQYDEAVAAPLDVLAGQGVLHYSVDADYAAEAVREIMVARFGEAAYTDGYKVTTTLVDRDQTAANAAVRAGLLAYDRRNGWRGPERHVDLPDGEHAAAKAAVAALKNAHDVGGLKAAVVLQVSPKTVVVVRRDGQQETISGDGLAFCRPGLYDKAPAAKRVVVGSVVRLLKQAKGGWDIVQLPQAQSALVSLQPQTGAVMAWVGGFDFNHEKFDHVDQAYRQPGSSFKPFIYSAAVAEGLAPSTIIDDAPISINPGAGQPLWQPHNYENAFSGPMPAAAALAHSDNVSRGARGARRGRAVCALSRLAVRSAGRPDSTVSHHGAGRWQLHPAANGACLRRVRQRRLPGAAHPHQQSGGRARQRAVHRTQNRPGRGRCATHHHSWQCLFDDPHDAGRHSLRHRRCRLGLGSYRPGRQDWHHLALFRRLVRRLQPQPRDHHLGGLQPAAQPGAR